MISNPMASVTGRISEEPSIHQFDHFRSSPTRASSGQADCTNRERWFSGSMLLLVLFPEPPRVLLALSLGSTIVQRCCTVHLCCFTPPSPLLHQVKLLDLEHQKHRQTEVRRKTCVVEDNKHKTVQLFPVPEDR